MTSILLAAALLSQTRLAYDASLTVTGPAGHPNDNIACMTQSWRPLVGESMQVQVYINSNDPTFLDGTTRITFRDETSIRGGVLDPGFFSTSTDGTSLVDFVGINLNDGTAQALFVDRNQGTENPIACNYALSLDTWDELQFGDANRNGLFDSADMIAVFQAGQYEDDAALNSTWATGDWNADAEFNSGDLVVALQTGLYEKQPGPVVPEPSCLEMVLALSLLIRMRPSRSGQASARHSPRFATSR